ncbi:related to GRIP1 associated protein 1 [Cephalotrichum gorgonifer]|uniref:Related to GRIP1 associated protein 1 n=1 Tax=Cephalotrichum gorgonifer TaxID=2041049 RepID=A0AAE8T087_9PEZI|nr:related to GRIP1 associated protein 1 [Cephalotrichum gorgonifer]
MSRYGDGAAFPSSRGQLASPPTSGGSNGQEPMNGFAGPRGMAGPSPPPSIARSSTYARSESGRSTKEDQTEAILGARYLALKKFLNVRDGRSSGTTPKAKDKLLRLTGVQLIELSTDVYDELKRRQDTRAPQSLPPESSFHPKRNQARQKLSSLSSERFQSLATDVFTELGRRFPHFAAGDIPRMGSSMSMRPPRTTSRRRPSDASSIRGPGQLNGSGYGDSVPPSPSLANGEFSRPLQKQFQSNTIVPNKSTMVEEDDDAPEGNDPAFGSLARAPTNNMDSLRSPDTQASPIQSEADKRLIDDYQSQVRELREKLDTMEDDLKRKDDELNNVLDGERTRASAANVEKQAWDDLRLSLENKLAEAQDLNESLRDEIERARADHSNETRELRGQISDLQDRLEKEQQATAAAASMARSSGDADPELQRENRELQAALREQQAVTDEVRRNAQNALREMRELSQQSNVAYERQEGLERTIDQLEKEVREWRDRYTKAKTQLRSLRASSMGLTMEKEATRHLRDRGFTDDNGMVKDIHVTKFQVGIDDILQQARTENADKVMDAMKAVVVNVRRITKDMDMSAQAAPRSDDFVQQQAKLKSRVSQTANAFITAAKNHANSAGMSPVSLLDAAASHLVSAVVELLRLVKIRPTPAGELEDDDDGVMTPVDSTGFFSPQSSRQESMVTPLAPPPAFQGLGARVSVDSSAYSPVNSPRESGEQSGYPPRSMSRLPNEVSGMNGGGSYYGADKGLPPPPPPNAYDNLPSQYGRADDLKLFLEDQTAVLVSSIQNLVGSIRSNSSVNQITDEIATIATVVGGVISETQSSGNGELVTRLEASRDKLIAADDQGRSIIAKGKGENDREWKMWTQGLPPVAFELAREMKELMTRVDQLGIGADDFS